MRYVVRTGEDINSISARHRVDPGELSSLNMIEGPIEPGDILEIPGQSMEPPSPPAFAVGGQVLQPRRRGRQGNVPGYALGGIAGQPPGGQVPGQQKPKKPPIFGQPMPDAGMKRPTMGQVKQPPQKLSPKNYAQEEQAKKRLRGMGRKGPGMMRPGNGQQPGAPQQAKRGGPAMLDQLWSNLGPQAQGFAEGGEVPGQPEGVEKYQEIYGKKMAELRASKDGESSPGGAPPRQGIAGIQAGSQGPPGGMPPGPPSVRGSGSPPPGMPSKPPSESPPRPPTESPPGGNGIASLGTPPKANAVEDSTRAVKAGIMAAASIPRSGSGISQILSA